jgi:hypothetical protein
VGRRDALVAQQPLKPPRAALAVTLARQHRRGALVDALPETMPRQRERVIAAAPVLVDSLENGRRF